MPDKRCERFYLDRLKEAISGFPRGRISEHESPDFLVSGEDRRLGIEMTVFHLPPRSGQRPHQEQQSLKDRIVERAMRLHLDAGGPGLYVEVFFYESPLTKSVVEPTARAIAEAILHCDAPLQCEESMIMVAVPRRFLPRSVCSVLVQASVDGEERIWDADAGGWVTPVTSDLVDEVIKRKGGMAHRARPICDELWLVIVNDVFSTAAPVDLADEAVHHVYEHPFDRLFWLLPHERRALELLGGSPVA